jgi:hypothetical protein
MQARSAIYGRRRSLCPNRTHGSWMGDCAAVIRYGLRPKVAAIPTLPAWHWPELAFCPFLRPRPHYHQAIPVRPLPPHPAAYVG